MCAHPTPEWCLALRTRWRQNGSKNMSRPASEVPVASAPGQPRTAGHDAHSQRLPRVRIHHVRCHQPCAPVAGAAASASSWASNGISESSSGTLFRAVRTRSYPGETLFASWTVRYGTASTHFVTFPACPVLTANSSRACVLVPLLLFFLPFISSRPSQQPAASELRVKSESTCRNWAVTTTIFPPTTTIKQIASLSDWCLVIAGDKKAPKDYQVSGRAIYLSPADQERMPFATGKLLRWNHFGRKNLGFLYALQHGARWVYDTDDDNELQSLSAGIPLPRPNALIDEVETQFKLYNLYPQMSTAPSSWPRGFPLESIKDRRTWNSSFTRRRWPARPCRVVQSLADHDPDVDGIYRLTQPLPFVFPPSTRRGGVAGRAGASGLAAQAAAKAATAPERAEEEQEGRRLAEARRAALKGAHLAGPTAKAMLKGRWARGVARAVARRAARAVARPSAARRSAASVAGVERRRRGRTSWCRCRAAP